MEIEELVNYQWKLILLMVEVSQCWCELMSSKYIADYSKSLHCFR